MHVCMYDAQADLKMHAHVRVCMHVCMHLVPELPEEGLAQHDRGPAHRDHEAPDADRARLLSK